MDGCGIAGAMASGLATGVLSTKKDKYSTSIAARRTASAPLSGRISAETAGSEGRGRYADVARRGWEESSGRE